MDFSLIVDQLQERLTSLGQQLLDLIPNLITALLVLLLGWLVSWLAWAVIGRLGASVVTRLSTYEWVGRELDGRLGRNLPRILAAIVYWALLLVFVAAAVEQLGVGVITELFGRLTQYLPNVVLAALILFAGVVLGNGARSGVVSAAASAGIGNATTLGRLVQIGVITATALVAADQIGVESTLLVVVFAITVGTSLGGAALAFGIGSGPMVGNIIAAHGLRKSLRIGQLVRIGTTEGRVLEIDSTSVSIETAEGTVHVPANRFSEEASVALREN